MIDELEIWAPRADEVALAYEGKTVVARATENGCYRAPAPPFGVDYVVVLDGKRRPDPRSQWQPHGVHGASQRIEHAFVWNDHAFRAQPLRAPVDERTSAFTARVAMRPRRPASIFSELVITHVEPCRWPRFLPYGWGYRSLSMGPALSRHDEISNASSHARTRSARGVLDVV